MIAVFFSNRIDVGFKLVANIYLQSHFNAILIVVKEIKFR